MNRALRIVDISFSIRFDRPVFVQMEGDDSSADLQALFLALRKHIRNDEFDKAVDTTDKILELSPGDRDATRSKAVALIQAGKFEAALEVSRTVEYLAYERAYCLYRLGMFDEALAATSALPPDNKSLHLSAQINFKARRFSDTSSIYEDILKRSEPDAEVLTNIYATYTANSEPEKVVAMHKVVGAGVDSTYELIFNKSCAELALHDYESAAVSLSTSRELCIKGMRDDGSSEDDIDRECAAILMQSAYLSILTGNTKGSASLCKSMMRKYRNEVELMAVAANNLAVLRGEKDLPDSLRRFRTVINTSAEEKLTTYQLCEIRFNRCVLLLHLRKIDECLKVLDELEKIYGPTARSAVIKASAWAIQGKWADVDALVEDALSIFSKPSSDRDRILLLKAQTLILRNKFAEARSVLSSDMSTLSYYPSTVSAIYALYELSGDGAAAQSHLADAVTVLTSDKHDVPSSCVYIALKNIARLYRECGMFAQAVGVYQSVLSTCELDESQRLSVLVKLIESLSHTPEGAVKYLQRLSEIRIDNSIDDIVALENRQPPRHHGKSKVIQSSVLSAVEKKAIDGCSRKRTPEQKARRKAKLREAYLKKLQAAGKYEPSRPAKPDPERWISRKERSFAKRGRKNRGKFVGGQGSGDGSQKDMQKLDAHARAIAKKEQEEAALNAKSSNLKRQKPKKR